MMTDLDGWECRFYDCDIVAQGGGPFIPRLEHSSLTVVQFHSRDSAGEEGSQAFHRLTTYSYALAAFTTLYSFAKARRGPEIQNHQHTSYIQRCTYPGCYLIFNTRVGLGCARRRQVDGGIKSNMSKSMTWEEVRRFDTYTGVIVLCSALRLAQTRFVNALQCASDASGTHHRRHHQRCELLILISL